MRYPSSRIFIYLLTLGLCLDALADVSLPSIFGEHMVLQREQVNPVWGNADVGEVVTVSINGQSHATVADEDGKWRIQLDPLSAGGPYTLSIVGDNEVRFKNVLVGEVWICSGQSNMEWMLSYSNHADVELATANNSQIRLMTVARDGTPELKDNFRGQWVISNPTTTANFSAIGFLFGKRLQNALNVPVGLIDNSWGASDAEAWVPREALEAAGTFDEYIRTRDEGGAAYTDEFHARRVREYEAWLAEGKPEPVMHRPQDPRYDQHRPANIYNGMVHPLVGYGIRGVIWYQGESNAGRRAAQYHEIFSLLISSWRDLWQQGDFPFYWVQLADYNSEEAGPSESGWAELREAQTKTLSLPNTGEAVIIDVGEGRDIHPRDKQTVADRLVRHALAKDYGYDMASESPRYASMVVSGNTVTLTFDHVSDGGLRAFDTTEVKGFSIAGADGGFVWADANIVNKCEVELTSDLVLEPVAVRYAWAINPVANLQDRNGLPVTPFRTDD